MATIQNYLVKRTSLIENIKSFHHEMQRQSGAESALKVYCRALCHWTEDPNTDLHQAERLFDEIRHASQLEDLDDWID
ncbi:hypothetical protein [Hymenobacter jeollabukensis]|uniref:Uncharacterized protein n=1 Tax=Hymenobacter jeollabukensis TaxID=2025313 RepID=A0A5R8WSR3_9BACT|nr:hypothetical protein [Hymenobacter jeollabukensis]TLM94220.1 hypothetical protein FDY95_09410 [Hymenobacter jeollabukensis]